MSEAERLLKIIEFYERLLRAIIQEKECSSQMVYRIEMALENNKVDEASL